MTLFSLTLGFDFIAISVSLWLAFYLLGRGFPSAITLRVVVVLLALAGFFLGAFFNIFHQVPGSASLRATLLVIVLATWNSLTVQLLPGQLQKRLRLASLGIYLAAVVTSIILVSTRSAFVGEQGNDLWVAHMGINLPYLMYGAFQVTASASIFYNLLSGPRIGLTARGRYFLVSSLLPIGAVIYGVLALAIPSPMPRLVQDGLVCSGVFLLSFAVARYQTLVERRTTLQDFLVSTALVLGLSAGYALLAGRLGFSPEAIMLVMVLAIITHSIYDLGREFLGRQRYHHESALRKQLRQLENHGQSPAALAKTLQASLELLCQKLDAGGGVIAVDQGETFTVAASVHSLPNGTSFPLAAGTCDDLFEPVEPPLEGMAWSAPAFAGGKQTAVVAIQSPRARLHYSPEDLDVLVEMADRVGMLISLAALYTEKGQQIRNLVSETQAEALNLRTSAESMLASLANNPDPRLIEMVEEALRHLSDYITLGQLPLAEWANVSGANHIERGRNLQQHLILSIEALHPAGKRPPGPLPREWYNYVVLYDAYVDCVPNREIMARLYVSEGTFNRTRRNALRGLARLLLERK